MKFLATMLPFVVSEVSLNHFRVSQSVTVLVLGNEVLIPLSPDATLHASAHPLEVTGPINNGLCTEAVSQRCSVKMVFMKISQNLPESFS